MSLIPELNKERQNTAMSTVKFNIPEPEYFYNQMHFSFSFAFIPVR